MPRSKNALYFLSFCFTHFTSFCINFCPSYKFLRKHPQPPPPLLPRHWPLNRIFFKWLLWQTNMTGFVFRRTRNVVRMCSFLRSLSAESSEFRKYRFFIMLLNPPQVLVGCLNHCSIIL